MNEARFRPNALAHGREERDDVVFCYFFDFGHALAGEVRFFLYDLDGLVGNLPQLGPRLTGQDFHLEPRPKLVLFAPDGGHLRSGISFYHNQIPTWQESRDLAEG